MRKTGFFIEISIVFAIGCSAGWLLELIFRRFWSGNNAEHRWVNPGYLRGPWLPVYGLGLLSLYLLSDLASFFAIDGLLGNILLVLTMTVAVTAVEYLAGVFSKRVLHATLWDYSRDWGNLDGIICPRFAFFWLILCSAYFFILHKPLSALTSAYGNIPATFLLIGIYLGLFFSDVITTSKLLLKVRGIFNQS